MPEKPIVEKNRFVMISLEKQVEIPITSLSRYITGMAALNLQAPEGTSGDWHFTNVYYAPAAGDTISLQLAGEGETINTNNIYGDYGVYECSTTMRKAGLSIPAHISAVYAANHYRAILDLLFRSLQLHHKVIGLIGATEDWLDTNEQKEFLLQKATDMLSFLSPIDAAELQKWIDKERIPGYRS